MPTVETAGGEGVEADPDEDADAPADAEGLEDMLDESESDGMDALERGDEHGTRQRNEWGDGQRDVENMRVQMEHVTRQRDEALANERRTVQELMRYKDERIAELERVGVTQQGRDVKDEKGTQWTQVKWWFANGLQSPMMAKMAGSGFEERFPLFRKQFAGWAHTCSQGVFALGETGWRIPWEPATGWTRTPAWERGHDAFLHSILVNAVAPEDFPSEMLQEVEPGDMGVAAWFYLVERATPRTADAYGGSLRVDMHARYDSTRPLESWAEVRTALIKPVMMPESMDEDPHGIKDKIVRYLRFEQLKQRAPQNIASVSAYLIAAGKSPDAPQSIGRLCGDLRMLIQRHVESGHGVEEVRIGDAGAAFAAMGRPCFRCGATEHHVQHCTGKAQPDWQSKVPTYLQVWIPEWVAKMEEFNKSSSKCVVVEWAAGATSGLLRAPGALMFDTGCTGCLVPSSEGMEQVEACHPTAGPAFVVANGENVRAVAQGDLPVLLRTDGGETVRVVLRGALVVPALPFGLVGLGALEAAGCLLAVNKKGDVGLTTAGTHSFLEREQGLLWLRHANHQEGRAEQLPRVAARATAVTRLRQTRKRHERRARALLAAQKTKRKQVDQGGKKRKAVRKAEAEEHAAAQEVAETKRAARARQMVLRQRAKQRAARRRKVRAEATTKEVEMDEPPATKTGVPAPWGKGKSSTAQRRRRTRWARAGAARARRQQEETREKGGGASPNATKARGSPVAAVRKAGARHGPARARGARTARGRLLEGQTPQLNARASEWHPIAPVTDAQRCADVREALLALRVVAGRPGEGGTRVVLHLVLGLILAWAVRSGEFDAHKAGELLAKSEAKRGTRVNKVQLRAALREVGRQVGLRRERGEKAGLRASGDVRGRLTLVVLLVMIGALRRGDLCLHNDYGKTPKWAVSLALAARKCAQVPRRIHVDDLHRVLGHLGRGRTKAIEQAVEGISVYGTEAEHRCEVCAAGKIRAVNVRRGPRAAEHTPWTGPRQWIGMDLTGQKSKSLSGYRHALVTVDMFSGYPRVEFTKGRTGAELSGAVLRLQAEIEAGAKVQGQTPVGKGVTLVVDDEFLHGGVRARVDAIGWQTHGVVPYEHATHGKTEVTVGVVMRTAKAILIDTRLDERFWTYAVLRAVWLLQRIPAGGKAESPFEMGLGRKPDLFHLQQFGTLVYVKDHHLRKGSVSSPRGLLGIYLGEAPRCTFGTRMVFMLGTKKTRRVQSVEFDSGVFPSARDDVAGLWTALRARAVGTHGAGAAALRHAALRWAQAVAPAPVCVEHDAFVDLTSADVPEEMLRGPAAAQEVDDDAATIVDDEDEAEVGHAWEGFAEVDGVAAAPAKDEKEHERQVKLETSVAVKVELEETQGQQEEQHEWWQDDNQPPWIEGNIAAEDKADYADDGLGEEGGKGEAEEEEGEGLDECDESDHFAADDEDSDNEDDAGQSAGMDRRQYRRAAQFPRSSSYYPRGRNGAYLACAMTVQMEDEEADGKDPTAIADAKKLVTATDALRRSVSIKEFGEQLEEELHAAQHGLETDRPHIYDPSPLTDPVEVPRHAHDKRRLTARDRQLWEQAEDEE